MPCFPDFNGDDFKGADFSTSSWTKRLNQFFFEKLPEYFKRNDSYKNRWENGILERYMATIGNELDNNVVPFIKCINEIQDPRTTMTKFFPHFTDFFSISPNLNINDAQYRNVISTIISFNKRKATRQYLKTYFRILGYDIDTYNLGKSNFDYWYDRESFKYDDHIIPPGSSDYYYSRYDSIQCPICYDMYVTISIGENHNGETVTGEVLDKLRGILEDIKPINSNIKYFNFV